MINNGVEFMAVRHIPTASIDLHMLVYEPGKGTAEAVSLQMSIVPEGEPISGKPLIRISIQDASQLMNALWNEGVRPSEQGSPGELAAVKRHLEDMRKIAFSCLPDMKTIS